MTSKTAVVVDVRRAETGGNITASEEVREGEDRVAEIEDPVVVHVAAEEARDRLAGVENSVPVEVDQGSGNEEIEDPEVAVRREEEKLGASDAVELGPEPGARREGLDQEKTG